MISAGAALIAAVGGVFAGCQSKQSSAGTSAAPTVRVTETVTSPADPSDDSTGSDDGLAQDTPSPSPATETSGISLLGMTPVNDCSVNNEPVKVYGVEEEQALPLGSSCREGSFQLDGKYSRFQAKVGLADYSDDGASATFYVELDGEVKKTVPVGLNETKNIDLDVTGVRRIKISANYDVTACVPVWVDPVVTP
ncbi:NPCBM/NEW2 domain-containing protein [Streptomyces phaeochromogenes]|uniref:NPCBM/NEW2 domain-containing protein n=1 Tax=Streptomyces phaeochromogenes TaxID=1923 RepID=UPI0038692195|nr:NPCBM/NEW2 domain-containing protein [Streptomyces phaeochromogenes]